MTGIETAIGADMLLDIKIIKFANRGLAHQETFSYEKQSLPERFCFK